MTRALLSGISGQDGSYLAEFLLAKGYLVFGTTRFSAVPNLANLKSVIDHPNLTLLSADMQDSRSLERAVEIAQPDEVYNLAGISYAPISWELPELTFDINATGVIRMLDAVRQFAPQARFYQASSTEMFGTSEPPQNEGTRFQPVHPYAVAKLAGHHVARQYREQHGLHVSCGILSNHESPRRSELFVTRKVTRHAARTLLAASYGQAIAPLKLWTLAPVRDWGFSGDYVRAMWLMLQQERADDYVIGTGIGHTVEELVSTAFSVVGLDWHQHVIVEPPAGFKLQVDSRFIADSTKARGILDWYAQITFEQLIEMMVRADLESLSGDIGDSRSLKPRDPKLAEKGA